jgi:hypothetical protein
VRQPKRTMKRPTSLALSDQQAEPVVGLGISQVIEEELDSFRQAAA